MVDKAQVPTALSSSTPEEFGGMRAAFRRTAAKICDVAGLAVAAVGPWMIGVGSFVHEGHLTGEAIVCSVVAMPIVALGAHMISGLASRIEPKHYSAQQKADKYGFYQKMRTVNRGVQALQLATPPLAAAAVSFITASPFDSMPTRIGSALGTALFVVIPTIIAAIPSEVASCAMDRKSAPPVKRSVARPASGGSGRGLPLRGTATLMAAGHIGLS